MGVHSADVLFAIIGLPCAVPSSPTCRNTTCDCGQTTLTQLIHNYLINARRIVSKDDDCESVNLLSHGWLRPLCWAVGVSKVRQILCRCECSTVPIGMRAASARRCCRRKSTGTRLHLSRRLGPLGRSLARHLPNRLLLVVRCVRRLWSQRPARCHEPRRLGSGNIRSCRFRRFQSRPVPRGALSDSRDRVHNKIGLRRVIGHAIGAHALLTS